MNKVTLGIVWFILSLMISSINDTIIKTLGSSLPPLEITFFRFFFATITLLPLITFKGYSIFSTSRLPLHMLRGAILFCAIALWCLGLQNVKIVSATITSFTVPIFVLILAPVFLKEKVTLNLWIATFICFMGIILLLDFNIDTLDMYVLLMLCSSLLFATLDIINKRFVSSESILAMLFFSNLFTMIISVFTLFFAWITPSTSDLLLLSLLGLGANGILYCILKAFTYVNASALAPYRYLELMVSFVFGYYLFNEFPSYNLWLSAAIIIPSTFYIAWQQCKQNNITA